MWMEEQIGKRINIDRVDEALDTLGDKIGGDVPQKVATGCPFCRVMLTDGVTARTSGTENEGKVEVVDVAQLLLESVTRGPPRSSVVDVSSVRFPSRHRSRNPNPRRRRLPPRPPHLPVPRPRPSRSRRSAWV